MSERISGSLRGGHKLINNCFSKATNKEFSGHKLKSTLSKLVRAAGVARVSQKFNPGQVLIFFSLSSGRHGVGNNSAVEPTRLVLSSSGARINPDAA